MTTQSQHAHGRKLHETEHNGEVNNDFIREAIEEFRERSDDLKATVTEYVNEKPFKSLAIAAGIGAVLALLIKR